MTSSTRHVGVTCDGIACRQEICGVRFKCTVCSNTDFCEACEPHHDAQHPRIMYRKPLDQSERPNWSLMRMELMGMGMLSSMGPSMGSSIYPAASPSNGYLTTYSSTMTSMNHLSMSEQREPATTESMSYKELMQKLEEECDPEEKEFFKDVVNLEGTPDDYSNVFINKSTIEALESNLILAIERAQEFEYGVLSLNRVTGAILYGPPGTGKTLLAQAVAKKCKLNLLCISPGNIYSKWWGDDAKAIRGAFGLARKLYPCIMFVDEADGIMGKRKDLDQKFVRSMLSEFLREWDGASEVESRQRSPFILLASNAPWDIDSAALRRAPVRIPVPLPSEEDRVGIFGIMLRDELLAPDITIQGLARATENFSGSDIKTLCVAAATRCIQEQKPNHLGQYDKRRVLTRGHFLFALRYVRASTMDAEMARKMEEFQKNGVY
ncbi:hypothetical protein VTJ83DRAFT_6039 [Remersonia thermophila]|uniref:AAA+ ATPase domain-containing protein n=1 Tax=Remersonia thermophila TaxID=72144 RepID=A0ABR4DAQ9_9PEZI